MKMRKATLVCAILASMQLGAFAETVTVPVTNGEKAGGRKLKDVVIKVTNAKITGVTDDGGFAKNKVANGVGSGSVKFDGANLAPGATTSVTFETNRSDGSKGKITKISYTNGDERATSDKDDIFGKAVSGGNSGLTFAGVVIPAHQWGYFYQFDRSAFFPASPNQLAILIAGGAPTSLGFLNNTWLTSTLIDDLPQNVDGVGGPYTLVDDMTEANLTGSPGIAPDSWTYSSGAMIATYSTPFGVNDVSSVLWFTDPLGPEVGGPLSINGENATITSFDPNIGTMFKNGTVAPTAVPEPGTLASFVGMAVTGWLVLRRCRKTS